MQPVSSQHDWLTGCSKVREAFVASLALLTCSQKIPCDYITQQYIRRVFYFFEKSLPYSDFTVEYIMERLGCLHLSVSFLTEICQLSAACLPSG